jgi:tetratricopeptide (TPR) repeat protein
MTGLCYYWTDNYERAVDLLERAYQLANQIQSVRDLLRSGGSLGMTLAAAGRYADAEKMFTEVVAKGRELEQVPRWTSRAVNMWAGALRDRLDFAGARRMNQEALELAGTAAFTSGVLQSQIDLLFCDLAEGEAGRADAAWPGLQEMYARVIGHHRWLIGGRLAEARSEIDLQLGRPADAANSARHAIDVARQTGRKRYEVAARIALGRALLGLERRDDALTELRRSERDAGRIKNPHLMWRAGIAVGSALDARGDDAGALISRERARKVATRIGVTAP